MAIVSGSLMTNVVPWPGAGLNIDAAPQLHDLLADHVHPDAAAGDVGDLRGRGEARLEDEAEHFLIGKMFAAGDQAALLGLGEDLFAHQAAAVVGNLDVDESALVIGLQVELRATGLLPAATRASGGSAP